MTITFKKVDGNYPYIVASKYPLHAVDGWSIVNFEQFMNRPWYGGFAYDYITNDEITKALDDDLKKVNVKKDWEDCWKYPEKSQSELTPEEKERITQDFKTFHARRIAKLVSLIQQGEGINPVSVYIAYGLPVTYSGGHAVSYMDNGHHRIRALQYLGADTFPACIGGVVDEITAVVDKRTPGLQHYQVSS